MKYAITAVALYIIGYLITALAILAAATTVVWFMVVKVFPLFT